MARYETLLQITLAFVLGVSTAQAREGPDLGRYAKWWTETGVDWGKDPVFYGYLKSRSSRPVPGWPKEAYDHATAIHMTRGEWGAALKTAEAAHSPDDVLIALVGLQKNGRWVEADRSFRAHVRGFVAGGHVDLKYTADWIGAWKGRPVAGKTFLQQISNREVSSGRFKAHGDSLWAQGYAALAAVEYERASVLGDESEELFVSLARCYLRAGQRTEFERTVSVGLARFPRAKGLLRLNDANWAEHPSPDVRAGASYVQWVEWILPTNWRNLQTARWTKDGLMYAVERSIGRTEMRLFDPVAWRLVWKLDPSADLLPYRDRGSDYWKQREIKHMDCPVTWEVMVPLARDCRKMTADFVLWERRRSRDGDSGEFLGSGRLELDAKTGDILSTVDFPGRGYGVLEQLKGSSHQGRYITLHDNHVVGIGLDLLGTPVWRYPVPGIKFMDASGPYLIFAALNGGKIVGLSAPTNLKRRRRLLVEAARSQSDPELELEILSTALDSDPDDREARQSAIARSKASGATQSLSRLPDSSAAATDMSLSFSEPAIAKRGPPARWSLQMVGTSGAAFDPERAYFLGHDYLLAIDRETGEERWRLRKTTRSSGPGVNHRLTLQGGTLFLAEGESYLKAVEARTGRVLWDKSVSETLDVASELRAPVVLDGDLLISHEYFDDESNSFDLLRVDGGDGTAEWKTRVNSEWNVSSRTIHSGYRWMLNRGQPAHAGGMAFFPAGIGGLRAVDVRSGRPLWTFREKEPAMSGPAGFGSPVAGDRRLFVAALSGPIYALDPLTGSVIWKTFSDGAAPLPETLTLSRGMVFFCDRNGMLRGLDGKNGARVWSRAGCAPPAIEHAGGLWMGDRKSLIGVDAVTGRRHHEMALVDAGNLSRFPWMKGIDSIKSDGKYLYLIDFFGVTQILPPTAEPP